MRTVHEVSKLAGVSIRTLQYYDKIGLLHPSGYTEAGYRLYDDIDLERLQQILLFRELEFPLKDIKNIIENPDFDRGKALEQQITLLTLKKERLENLIDFAREIKAFGGKTMDFTAFDQSKMNAYAAQAKASWGNTPEYREFEEKQKGRSPQQQKVVNVEMMNIFKEFGDIRDTDPASDKAQALVKKLQDFIGEHFYACSNEMLSRLGKLYVEGADFTTNIDQTGGVGTAEFTNRAIEIYCNQ